MEELNFEQIIDKWEKRVFRLYIIGGVAVTVVASGILASLIYIIKLQFLAEEPSYQLAAEICNTYTSIILGFVAMAVSLISIILSFYNTIQAEKSNIESLRQFNETTQLSKSLLKKLEPISDNLKQIPELIEAQSQIKYTMKEIQETLDSIKNTSQNGGTVVEGKPAEMPAGEYDDTSK
ncbi:MAG: hypothetical protein IJA80_02545 [Clostridia bacterium]|nr:hypothetical protein [Clostridia bacterium]